MFLHGGLGSMVDFNALIERIPATSLFIGIDLRGHGKSTMGADDMSYARYQQDVEAVLAHLDVSTVTVLVFSDGGIVGYRMTANSKNNIKKLIALGSQW
ncbi:alpha/beta hydrolase [uncultured Photobacterium sp.]|uniref:alpha/beta fold hydrolase n=1 Tax=uncultured Photobacterium sp. TaxID=173973 RepID=UPI002639A710|nr:alpha/beta hydrolase [uncultured Photobacterium sp.]